MKFKLGLGVRTGKHKYPTLFISFLQLKDSGAEMAYQRGQSKI